NNLESRRKSKVFAAPTPRRPKANCTSAHAGKLAARNPAHRQEDRFYCNRATRQCFAKNRGHWRTPFARSYRPAAHNLIRGIAQVGARKAGSRSLEDGSERIPAPRT